MSTPLLYILAPFALAFALFAVFLVVSIVLKDPARPFRMFAAPREDQEKDAPRPGSGQAGRSAPLDHARDRQDAEEEGTKKEEK